MSPANNNGGRLGPIIYLSQNWISRLGILLTTTGGVAWMFTLPAQLSGAEPNPYLGLLTFIALPIVFFLGLALIPLGIMLKQRRERSAGIYPSEFPPPRWSNPAFRQLLAFIFLATAANVIIGGQLTYSAVEYMDSTSFCGQACHIMTPEFVAWQDAPHSRVTCVECHIGAGAQSLIAAKLNGTKQLIEVLTNTYPTPVPTPVHNLAQGKLTCGDCHADSNLGEKTVDWISYSPDETNTALRTELRHIIGGGDNTRGAHGAHMAHGAKIEYRSDPERKTIPWLRYVSPAGAETIYATADWDPAKAERFELRTMDCVDCHNRPAHSFEKADKAIDRAMQVGKISTTLAFVKREGLAAITAEYPSREVADEQIPQRITAFYSGRPEAARTEDVRAAGQALAEIWERNVFPEWGVTWNTHENLFGHDEKGGDEGCFRCHSERLVSQDSARRAVGAECSVCHVVTAVDQPVETQAQPGALTLTSNQMEIPAIAMNTGSPAGAVSFDHRHHVELADGQCSTCHNRLFDMTRTTPVNYAAGLHKVAESNRSSCAFCHVSGGSAFASEGHCADCHTGLTESARPTTAAAAPTQPVLPGVMNFQTALGTATFDHAQHVRDSDGRCQDCHNSLFEMNRADLAFGGDDLHKAAEAAKSSCAGCHVAGGTSFAAENNCEKCHVGLEPPKATPTSGRSGVPAIPTIQTSLGEVKFDHAHHDELAKGDCGVCHTKLFPFAEDLMNYKDDLHKTAEQSQTSCAACHRPQGTAFASGGNCMKCHVSFGSSAAMPAQLVYQNPLGKVVYDHSHHMELVSVDCTQCHDELFPMEQTNLAGYAEDYHRTAEAAGKQCGSCHKPQGTAFAALNNCTRCHEGLKVKEVNADAGG